MANTKSQKKKAPAKSKSHKSVKKIEKPQKKKQPSKAQKKKSQEKTNNSPGRSSTGSSARSSSRSQKADKKDVKSNMQATVSKATQPKSESKTKPQPSSKYPQYSSDQLNNFKKISLELESNKLPELKDLCRKNLMKVSGTKPELIERIADAKILGVIPKCPACGGGRPKLDVKTMTYYCSGYLEDVDFINCHKSFAYKDISRVPWQD